MMSVIAHRVAAVRERMAMARVDAFLVTNGTNVTYTSGFIGHDSILFITRRLAYFITDTRYIEEAERTLKGWEVVLAKDSLSSVLKRIVSRGAIKIIGFESMSLPYSVAVRLKNQLGGVRFVPMQDAVENVRAVKDVGEIEAIRSASLVTMKTLNDVAGGIVPGATEREIAARIEMLFIKRGARSAFDSIVASGTHSSMPHTQPTDTKIRQNSAVMIDLGCSLNGYRSDMTRIVMLGKVAAVIRRVYAIVAEAQRVAIEAVRPGARASDVDQQARQLIEREGYGENFGHAVGHGVGLDIHEQPSISRSSHVTLCPGMVFTVEPAIYLPGVGGVRIEDVVVVTPDGRAVLTR